MKRRTFLNLSAAMIGATLGSDRFAPICKADSSPAFAFDQPFDGGIYHPRNCHSVMKGNQNNHETTGQIVVSGTVPRSGELEVFSSTGEKATVERHEDRFTAVVPLTTRFNTIEARYKTGDYEKTIITRPVWLGESFPRYRFQIDDNSFFLRDIYQKNYDNLFDSFYLNGLRKLHQKYNTRFVLNCFYSTPEEDFNLSMFSDKYKSQWNDNADWLRLAFHAENEFPDRPYENATSEELAADFDRVNNELLRFADNAYTPPGIVHWGTAPPDTHHVFAERGVKSLSGYFSRQGDSWSVHFQLPNNVCEYLSQNDGWYDHQTGIVFSRLDIVCNSVSLEQTVPTLQKAVDDPRTAEVLDLLTHEQYFWPTYHNYIPDHFDRLDVAIGFAVERGYKPVWYHTGFYGV